MQVQLSQSTALQIRDANAQRNEVTTLQQEYDKVNTELRDLRHEKLHWDDKLKLVHEQAALAKRQAAARIEQLEGDVKMLMQNLKTSHSSLKNFNSNRLLVRFLDLQLCLN